MAIDGVESVLCYQSPPPGLKHPSSQLLTTQISVSLQNLALAQQIYPVQIMPLGFPTPSNGSVRGKEALALNGDNSEEPCELQRPLCNELRPPLLRSSSAAPPAALPLLMGMLRDV